MVDFIFTSKDSILQTCIINETKVLFALKANRFCSFWGVLFTIFHSKGTLALVSPKSRVTVKTSTLANFETPRDMLFFAYSILIYETFGTSRTVSIEVFFHTAFLVGEGLTKSIFHLESIQAFRTAGRGSKFFTPLDIDFRLDTDVVEVQSVSLRACNI